MNNNFRSADKAVTMPSSAGTAPPGCRLRESVGAADGEAVRSLVARTGFFRPEEIEVAVELVCERLARGPACGYEFLFAERTGQSEPARELIGYACYGPIACTLGSYDLYWIAVDPRWQGLGLGRRLLVEAESRMAAAGAQQVYIDTSGRQQYSPTRAFYERSGYQVAGRLSDFYAPGDDRVIYVKRVGRE
jgi:ribosomal protein S18 acetylase RimI-like enzyme